MRFVDVKRSNLENRVSRDSGVRVYLLFSGSQPGSRFFLLRKNGNPLVQ